MGKEVFSRESQGSSVIIDWAFDKSQWKSLGTGGIPQCLSSKEFTCNAGDTGSVLDWEDPLEKGLATHSSILAWRIPQTEEPGGLQSMGSQGVRTLSD